MEEHNFWLQERNHYFTNYNEFGEWEQATEYDKNVSNFLRTKYAGADTNVLLFNVLCFVTAVFALFTSMIKGYELYITVLLTLTAGVLLYYIIAMYKDNKVKKELIKNQDYELCEVTAHICEEKGLLYKYCNVEDKNQCFFLEKYDDEEPRKKRIQYYSYFSGNDYSAKVVRIKDKKKGFVYYVLPMIYIEEKE